MTFILFSFPGGFEWILILFAILLLFGGRKIPELMRGIGKGIREFNTAKADLDDELKKGMNEQDEPEKKHGEEKKENKAE